MARRRSKKYIIPQLSTEEYEKQLAEQGGGCWICGRKPKTIRLSGDHSHLQQKLTGKIVRRGLLCYPCNRYVVKTIERWKINAKRLALYFETFGY
jgi:hypothetical protein